MEVFAVSKTSHYHGDSKKLKGHCSIPFIDSYFLFCVSEQKQKQKINVTNLISSASAQMLQVIIVHLNRIKTINT